MVLSVKVTVRERVLARGRAGFLPPAQHGRGKGGGRGERP